MENRNEIAVELSALSALVAGISRATPYGVPEDYFDQLPSKTLARVAARSGTFKVPEGYFDGFAASVLSRIKSSPGESAQDELSRLSPVISGITRATPYYLPEGYFEELSPVLTLLKDKRAYEVPEDYFGELSPLLTVAQNRSGYQVPADYFDTLPEQILEKVAPRVVSMRPLKGHWWSYATASAAAIAACFMLIFSLPGIDTNRESVQTAEQGLQKLSDQDLQAYLEDHHAVLGDTEDQHAMPGEPVSNSTASLDMNEGEVKSLLAGVSDQDLQQYLDENGKAEDIATN